MLKKLIARHIHLPLKKPVKHASHERHETENILIECHLDNGIVGYGEGVPRDYVTGETVDTAIDVLNHTSTKALAEQPASFTDAVMKIEQLELKGSLQNDERGIGAHSARCALELACLDAYGQHFKEPLSAVTKLIAPELYEPKNRIQYNIAITSDFVGVVPSTYPVDLIHLFTSGPQEALIQIALKPGTPGDTHSRCDSIGPMRTCYRLEAG